MSRSVLAIVVAVAPGTGAAAWVWPSQTAAIITGAACLALSLLVAADSRARTASRHEAVAAAFAHMAIIRAGRAVRIPRDPVRAECRSHPEAFREALRMGSWAVIVRAYDRYYVLRARTVDTVDEHPLSFMTHAVADLIPAVEDDRRSSA